MLAHVRARPALLTAPTFSGGNSVMHMAARYGATAMVTALFDLLDELRAEEQRLAREAALTAADGHAASKRHGSARVPAAPPGSGDQSSHFPAGQSPGVTRTHSGSSSASSASSGRPGAGDEPPVRHGDGAVVAGACQRPAAAAAAKARHAQSAAAALWSLPQRADVANVRNNNAQTPLHVAASRGHADIVLLLLQMVSRGVLRWVA